jgi:phytoene/squalene synthetase
MLPQMTAHPGLHSSPNTAQGTASAQLARAITWEGSRQSYLIARLLVDRDLQDDCYRAYAYIRWVDDVVDEIARSVDERVMFINRQRDLVDRLCRNERPGRLAPEEEIIADLISHFDATDCGLHSFIRNFLAIIEFDAYRKGKLVSQRDLLWYSRTLGVAVTDAILHFVGHGRVHPESPSRYLAATAAHITHMLRDMAEDVGAGYVNIPQEYMELHGIHPGAFGDPRFRTWVESRVKLARSYFREGKAYLDQLEDLRSKIAGYWYCARFEVVLDEIERAGYVLAPACNRRKALPFLFRMARMTLILVTGHAADRIRRQVLASGRSESPRKIFS